MSFPVRVLILAVGLLAWGVAPSAGQPDTPRLEAIWGAYEQLDYPAARTLAQAALDGYERYTPEELADVHIILGLIEFSQNQPVEASRQFTDALVLYPSVELDSMRVSPKILSFFEEVRARLAQTRREETPASSAVRYVVVEDRRVEAALRSMVLPGWGQLHKGERAKGRVLLGVWGATAAGGVAAHLLREQARRDYEAAGTPAEALDRYDPFNRWHKTRNALLLGAAGLWIYGYVDALVTDRRTEDRRALLLFPAFADRQVHLVARLRF